MSDDKRRYFVVEGPEAEALKQKVLGELNKQRAEKNSLASKHGADQVFQWNDGRVAGLVYAGGDDHPETPEGLSLDQRQPNPNGGFWYVFKPNKRGKAGKAIAAEFAAIKGYRGSDEIVSHFKAYRGQVVGAASSRTGMAYAVSVAGIIKDKIVLSVPDVENEPFDAPPCMREIKKSEYIAITEE